MRTFLIFLLRVLISWWYIPIMTIGGFPLWCLLGGWDAAVKCLKFTIDMMWYGEFIEL